MKRFTKTMLASAAILAIAALPVLAAGPGTGTGLGPNANTTAGWNCPGGGPGGGYGVSAKSLAALKLTDAQKTAYDAYQKLANEERQSRWDFRSGLSAKALEEMSVEQFRDFQSQQMQSRAVSMTKISEARQTFIDTLTADQKKLLETSYGFGPGGRGPGGRRGGGGMMF